MSDISEVEVKVAVAKQKKEQGDAAFSQDDVPGALRAYHEALMYLLGLDKNAMQAVAESTIVSPAIQGEARKSKEEQSEADFLIEKIYANMSACHIKRGNWKRALETADKAIAKNENCYKGLLRKGKALGELGFFEKAEKVLEDLAKKNPEGIDVSYINKELARLKAIDEHRERVNNEKMKGFLTRGVKKSLGKDVEVTKPQIKEESDALEASANT